MSRLGLVAAVVLAFIFRVLGRSRARLDTSSALLATESYPELLGFRRAGLAATPRSCY